MIRSIVLLLGLAAFPGSRTLQAQDWTTVENVQASFPADMEGNWSGTLSIHFPGVAPKKVPMALSIHPVDSVQWSWTIIYNPGDQEDRRPYALVPVDPEKGEWVIDEGNGIVLGGQVLGPVFLSRFEVGGQLLLSRYEASGDTLRFEIMAGPMDGNETGGSAEDQSTLEAIPPVTWYGIQVYQVALLTRS